MDLPAIQSGICARADASASRFRTAQSVWSAARFTAAFPPPPSEIIFHLHAVNLDSVNGFHLCRRSDALEPRRRTPRILIRHRHEFVLHRVLMNVIQPGQVAVLNRQLRVTEIKPNLSVRDRSEERRVGKEGRYLASGA